MRRFEYMQEIYYDRRSYHENLIPFVDWLNDFGEEGWELVESHLTNDIPAYNDLECTFKRELSGERDV